jgi:hypothetical protein
MALAALRSLAHNFSFGSDGFPLEKPPNARREVLGWCGRHQLIAY